MRVGRKKKKFYSDWIDVQGVRRRKLFLTEAEAWQHNVEVGERCRLLRLAALLGKSIREVPIEDPLRVRLLRECRLMLASTAEGKKLPVSVVGPTQERLAI